jgi:hypothetical protein
MMYVCTTQVEMPGEPKMKKFEDWQKKATVYYNSFKNAKVGASCISTPLHHHVHTHYTNDTSKTRI